MTSTTLLPGDTGPPAAENNESTSPGVAAADVLAGPSSIASITAYDPDGDGVENNEDAVLAQADGDSTTFWRTVCYESKYMGTKRGVGLVVSFDSPTQQALSVGVLSAPYQLEFYTSDAELIPTKIDAWGDGLGETEFASTPGTVTSADPPAPVRHMLIMLSELGPDDSCTGSNPYRGRLGEISIAG